MKWASWLNLIIGIWLLFAPWVLNFGSTATSNNILFGILVIIVAAWSLGASAVNTVPAWINLVFGVWLFISPWVLGYATGAGALWNDIIAGVLLVIFAVTRMTMPRMTMPA